jgi:hypothetical protein
MITVRNLREGESLPPHFKTGYEKMPVMQEWVWLAEDEGVPVGALLAAPAHGVIFLMRIYTVDVVNTPAVRGLLRSCFVDCDKRGFKGFLFHVNPGNEVERQFIPLVEKWGGFQHQEIQAGLVGPLVRGAWNHMDKSALRRMAS